MLAQFPGSPDKDGEEERLVSAIFAHKGFTQILCEPYYCLSRAERPIMLYPEYVKSARVHMAEPDSPPPGRPRNEAIYCA